MLAWKDKKKELQENKTAEEADERCPYQPQITQYAANLEREGDVGSRLYNKAFEYRAKRQEEIERQMLEIEQVIPLPLHLSEALDGSTSLIYPSS